MTDPILVRLRALAWPGYLVAVLLVVLPMVDLVSNVWPARVGQVQWRFGTLGLLSGFLLTPLLGIVLAMAAAAVLEHGRVLRTIGALDLVAAALLVLAVPLFGLDWLQMRAGAPPDAVGNLDVGSVKSILKHLSVAGALAWLGVVGIRRRVEAASKRAARVTTPIVRPPGERGS